MRCDRKRAATRLHNGMGVVLGLAAAVVLGGITAAWGDDGPFSQAGVDVTPRKLEFIPPGTRVGDTPPRGWSHIVYVARRNLAQGDVREVSQGTRDLVSRFQIVVLANVVARRSRGRVAYELDKVAVGFAVADSDELVVVSSDPDADDGVSLGFLSKQVLSGNEDALRRDGRQVARTPTMLVFDSVGVVLDRGEHRKMVLRNALLVSPATGKLTAFHWVLDPGQESGYRLAQDDICRLSGTRMEHVLNVDADKFVLGIPLSDAFAFVKLKPADEIPWPAALKPLAATRRFTAGLVPQLEAELAKLTVQFQ